MDTFCFGFTCYNKLHNRTLTEIKVTSYLNVEYTSVYTL